MSNSNIGELHDLFQNHLMKTHNNLIDCIISKFHFYLINKKYKIDDEINNKENASNVIAIDQYDKYFMICLDDTFIMIENSYKNLLCPLFIKNKKSKIYFVKNEIKNSFIDDLTYLNIQPPELIYEIDDYNQFLDKFYIKNQPNKEIKQFYWKISYKCYFQYLIMKSYTSKKIDRVLKSPKIISTVEDSDIKDDDYICIKSLNMTASSTIDLIYHIKFEELFVAKKYDENVYNKRIELGQLPLFEREKRSYIQFSHQFISDYIGTISKKSTLIIEYIKGETLLDIKELHLNAKEKMKIIFELLITIQFLHFKSHIYRDLKPNNIMIDENKNIVLIDFDRLIECKNNNICDGESVDIGTIYMAPEIMEKQYYSYSADIYSIGKIIYYILYEKKPTSELNANDCNNQCFYDFYKKCTNIDPTKRPTISQVINKFLFDFGPLYENDVKFDRNLIQIYENNLLLLDNENINTVDPITLEAIYRNGKYTKQDTMKMIYYANLFLYKKRSIALYEQAFFYENNDFAKALEKYKESAELNNPDAQLYLGYLYYTGEKVKKDIKKAAHYFTLSANNNNAEASFLISNMHLNGDLDEKNLNKAIFYLKKAADLNDDEAQYEYGNLFYIGEKVPFDINKTIEYFTKAANNNNIRAICSLGLIYYDGKYVEKDIKKSMYYYKIAACRNEPNSQYFYAYICLNNHIDNIDIYEAIGYLMLAVNNKQIEAMYKLGILYIEGILLNKDIAKGLELLSNSASQNNPDSMFTLALFNLDGIYLPKNIPKALNILTELSVKHKYKEAQYLLCKYYADKTHPDTNKSLSYLVMAANNNHAEAQNELGCMYDLGMIFDKNDELAIHYLTLAANQNYAEAQYNLGNLYFLKNDIEKSLKYLNLAAKNGNAFAQYNLGVFYYQGKFVEKDNDKAIKYFSDSAKQEFVEAQYNLAQIHHSDPLITKDIPKSLHYYKLAADPKKGNHAKAQFNLAKIYMEGKLVEQDVEKAIYYYQLAANQHHEHALNNLANLMFNGKYVKKDIPKAIKYYELAASKRLPESCCMLGDLYKTGEYVEKNIKKAFEYFKMAAQSEYPKAYCEIAKILYKGIEIEQNVELAFKYLNFAYNKSYYDAYFIMGYYYQTGLYIEKDLSHAMSLYINSTHMITPSKNNLGICYLSIKNVDQAIVHFLDGVKVNDTLSMYNLAAIYCCEKYNHLNLNESIRLLKKSYEQGFRNSLYTLAIALIKQNGQHNINKICETINNDELKDFILHNLNKEIFVKNCKFIEDKFFLYNDDKFFELIDLSIEINQTKHSSNKSILKKNIDESFRRGFGEI